MTSTDDRKVQWRVQVRKSRAHKWVNKGLFETRADARYDAACHRLGYGTAKRVLIGALGFGNTRVLRYVRGQA